MVDEKINEDDHKDKNEDENKKEEGPCTSKQAKASDRGNSHRTDEDKKGRRTNSTASLSASHSSKTELEEANEMRPPVTEAKGLRGRRKKTTRRARGRIQKRRRSTVRRVIRKPLKKRLPTSGRSRERSYTTIYSALSSRSRSTSPCPHCGHRCRHPRYEEVVGRYKNSPRRNVKMLSNKRKSRKDVPAKVFVSEGIQAGSRCVMLSPLFVGTNATLTSENIPETEMRSYQEVTPEMIYESIRSITMWTLSASTSSILDYMTIHYPVNTNQQELFEELLQKLLIASEAGICIRSIIVTDTPDGKVTHVADDSWCLNCALRDRELTKDQITLFWNIYADTLRPVARKSVEPDDARFSEARF